MTDSHDTVVSDVRASVSTLRSWADAVIGNWDSYAALHRDHDGFEDCRDGWVEVRDGIRKLCTTVTSRVDDSSWMADLEDREAFWSRAATRGDDATDAVADARLRATESWTQGASDRYREVIPGQRIALARAHSGLTWMANGCTGAVEAGLRQLTSVRDALEAVELPGYFGEADGSVPENDYGDCTFGHHTQTGLGNLGREPLEAAETAVSTAWSTMRTEVRDAFKAVDPDVPPYVQPTPVPIAQSYESSPWPTVGAG
jgi:hypothetical protein